MISVQFTNADYGNSPIDHYPVTLPSIPERDSLVELDGKLHRFNGSTWEVWSHSNTHEVKVGLCPIYSESN
jgi:hypothetical protein